MVHSAYSRAEMMTVIASRELRDGECVFVGIGLPNVACNLARLRHAPGLQLIYESGVYGAAPERQPLSIGDPCLVTGSIAVSSMFDIFTSYLQRGHVDVGVLGGAQVDRFGNINTTVIGDYARPTVRLPGSGGACDIAHLAASVLIITPLRRRAFPERVDFVTSPGFNAARNRHDGHGIRGGGPRAVITDQCVFRFDPDSGELFLASLYPDVTEQQIAPQVGWSLRAAPHLETLDPPEPDELRLIREVLDPQGIHVQQG